MQPLYCVRVIIVRLTSGQNLEVLNIINTDTKTYKNIRKSQSMIKKLSASHQEIKIIADAYFEIKNWTLFHTLKNEALVCT
jgi:hypothetical protein